jgi:hypothetical protein
MRPERVAELVAWWARFYTRGLAPPIAERRIAEIDADLHDHIEHERAAGISDRAIARAIASRMLRGLAADLAWRGRRRKQERMNTLSRSAARVALGVAVVLSLPLVAMQFTDEVVWSLADFVLAAVLLATIGVAIELAVKKAGNLGIAVGIGALGVAAGFLGQAGDAPGLVLLGLLLILSACALGVRAARAS